MKVKTQIANITANATNAMINWQPFNHRPFTSLYDWAHKVRANDPAWREFVEKQDMEILTKAMDAGFTVHSHCAGGSFESGTERRMGSHVLTPEQEKEFVRRFDGLETPLKDGDEVHIYANGSVEHIPAEDTAKSDRKEMIDDTKPGFFRRNIDATTAHVRRVVQKTRERLARTKAPFTTVWSNR